MPEQPTQFDITLDPCGVRFLPGHRIRVELSSSWFRLYDRNTNTGAENIFTDRRVVIADQRVYHQPELASCVVLPVIRHRRPEAPD